MKPFRLARTGALLLRSFCLLVLASAAHGHEFILKPFGQFQAQPGGRVAIDKQDIPYDQARDLLNAGLAVNSEPLVFINPDERVARRIVLDVMDQVQHAGVAKMAIAIQLEEGRSEK